MGKSDLTHAHIMSYYVSPSPIKSNYTKEKGNVWVQRAQRNWKKVILFKDYLNI